MHGIPESWIEHATAKQLQVLLEIVERDEKAKMQLDSAATNKGIADAFGDGK